MNRAAIIAALELSGSRCCDSEDDREAIADVVAEVLSNQMDALIVREFFVHCTNPGTRLIALHEQNGKVQSKVLEAAWRLAGGGQ